jgi:hypothetical protein
MNECDDDNMEVEDTEESVEYLPEYALVEETDALFDEAVIYASEIIRLVDEISGFTDCHKCLDELEAIRDVQNLVIKQFNELRETMPERHVIKTIKKEHGRIPLWRRIIGRM